MAREPGEAPQPARRLRDGGAAPLRGRWGEALRPGGGDHGAGAVAAGAFAGGGRRARGAPPARRGEGEARGLRVREHGIARGAGRVRGVRDARAHRGVRRLLWVAVLAAVVAGAALYLGRASPPWFERLRYPLRYSQYVRVHARENHLDPALLAAVIYQESK